MEKKQCRGAGKPLEALMDVVERWHIIRFSCNNFHFARHNTTRAQKDSNSKDQFFHFLSAIKVSESIMIPAIASGVGTSALAAGVARPQSCTDPIKDASLRGAKMEQRNYSILQHACGLLH